MLRESFPLTFSAREPLINVNSKDVSRAQSCFLGCLCQTFSLVFRKPNGCSGHFQSPINVCFEALPKARKVLF